jgi:hypothetical protein
MSRSQLGPPTLASRRARGVGKGHGPRRLAICRVTTAALRELARLLRVRNPIDTEISQIIHRPMTAGHAGEWIAAHVFDIELESIASMAAYDGHFRSGPLAGKTVNVKWYLKQESVLDMTNSDALAYYLVMTGPPPQLPLAKGGPGPWVIESLYLFDTHRVLTDLRQSNIKIGLATSVRKNQWSAAEICPKRSCPFLTVSDEQRPCSDSLPCLRRSRDGNAAIPWSARLHRYDGMRLTCTEAGRR